MGYRQAGRPRSTCPGDVTMPAPAPRTPPTNAPVSGAPASAPPSRPTPAPIPAPNAGKFQTTDDDGQVVIDHGEVTFA